MGDLCPSPKRRHVPSVPVVTSPHRARRTLTTLAIGSLVAATLGALSTAAVATPTRNVFTQPDPLHLGDGEYEVRTAEDLAIAIPSAGTTATYPLELEVPHAARIRDIQVDVALQHDHPSDLELLLVGPGGQQVMLLNGAGGGDPIEFEAYMTFWDDAARELAPGDTLPSSELRPASFDDVSMTSPASARTAGTELSVFDGTIAAGVWQLYVNDAADDAGGTLLYWGLELELGTAPYPSRLEVAGVGSVTDVNVSLDDLSGYPDDADLMLVGPQGQRAMLLSDAGGDANPDGLDLTLDDEAAGQIPNDPDEPLAAGSYQPTNHGVTDELPELGELFRAPSALSAFDGTDPNGSWRLYASDDSDGGAVLAIEGWSLDLETDDLTSPSGTVSVAAGAAYATAGAVIVNLTSTDPAPRPSGTQQMRFSNDGTTWSAYQAYAPTTPWTLAPGQDGSRTVFAQFRDGNGNLSPVVSDSITLDTAAPRGIKVKPRNRRAGVKPTARVKVIATETLARASVTPASVFLKHKGGARVRAEVTVRGAKIILDPRRALKPGTYRVTVTRAVTDLAGNGFDAKRKAGTQTLRWVFTV